MGEAVAARLAPAVLPGLGNPGGRGGDFPARPEPPARPRAADPARGRGIPRSAQRRANAGRYGAARALVDPMGGDPAAAAPAAGGDGPAPGGAGSAEAV